MQRRQNSEKGAWLNKLRSKKGSRKRRKKGCANSLGRSKRRSKRRTPLLVLEASSGHHPRDSELRLTS